MRASRRALVFNCRIFALFTLSPHLANLKLYQTLSRLIAEARYPLNARPHALAQNLSTLGQYRLATRTGLIFQLLICNYSYYAAFSDRLEINSAERVSTSADTPCSHLLMWRVVVCEYHSLVLTYCPDGSIAATGVE